MRANFHTKQIILFFFIIKAVSVFSQSSIVFNSNEVFGKQNVDTVKVGLYFFSDKEYMGEDVLDQFILIKDTLISSKEIKQLDKLIRSKKSFSNQQALLNHVDVEFKYFVKSKVVQRILISSFTRNFVMFDESGDIIIRSSISKKFHHYIAILLKRYGLWNSELEFNFYENC